MRVSFLLGCLLASAVCAHQASAHMMDHSMGMNAGTTENESVAGPRINQDTAYDQYIVNPTETTNTRDNRGSIPEALRARPSSYTPDNNGSSNGNWNRTNDYQSR